VAGRTVTRCHCALRYARCTLLCKLEQYSSHMSDCLMCCVVAFHLHPGRAPRTAERAAHSVDHLCIRQVHQRRRDRRTQ